MTVGELIDQMNRLAAAGFVTMDTPVLTAGCDCWGEAKAAVVVDQDLDGRPGHPHLLVSREDPEPIGVRARDLVLPTPPI